MRNLLGFTLLLVFSISGMFAQTSLEFIVDKQSLSIKRGSDIPETLQVYRGHITKEEISKKNPILGKTILKKKELLTFIPVVPFDWNLEYTVAYNNMIDHFVINLPNSYEHLSVEAVYPSGRIPANILKWHIKFSSPINENNVYDHIRFIRSLGDTIPKAILPLENALISDDGKLLTLWIEPGRQKRNLIPNKQLGPVFEKDNIYQLAILKDLRDNKGVSMQEDFTHIFQTTVADRVKPDTSTWEVMPPNTNTEDLVILCHESMDYTSTINELTVINADKKEIPGDWLLKDHETILIFTPKKPWNKGNYKIMVDANIEDPAGNNLNRLFDSKISNNKVTRLSLKYHNLDFKIE